MPRLGYATQAEPAAISPTIIGRGLRRALPIVAGDTDILAEPF
jgi:hypothetical protein